MGAPLLIVLGCLLVPFSLVAVWTNNQVSDTDGFVATMSPVIADPSVQAALADRVTAEVFTRVDVKQVADQAIDALVKQGLPPLVVDRLHALTGPLADGTRTFVRGKVGQLVATPQFAQAFNQAVAGTHQQINRVLSGESSAITIQGASVVLDLGIFIDAAKQQLVSRPTTSFGRSRPTTCSTRLRGGCPGSRCSSWSPESCLRGTVAAQCSGSASVSW